MSRCEQHADVGFDGEHWRCAACGQRFVPEPPFTGTAQTILERHANSVTIPRDVLEEARQSLVIAREQLLSLGSPRPPASIEPGVLAKMGALEIDQAIARIIRHIERGTK